MQFWSGCVVRALAVVVLISAAWDDAARAADNTPVVLDARLGVHPDRTRFVLELSKEPAYKVFKLSDPERVVIDLPDTTWENGHASGPSTLGLVSDYSVAQSESGRTRVVLRVHVPVTLKSVYVIPPNNGRQHRLVLDLMVADAEVEPAPEPAPEPASEPAPEPPVEAGVEPGAEPGPAASEGAEEDQVASLARPIPPPPTRKPDTRATIIIDPGHGGVDPGGIGARGTKEKSIILEMARELKSALERTGRYRVVLTRDDDTFVRLRDRLAVARSEGGDIFLSLHADSHNDRSVNGASVYTLSEQASDAEAEALAAKENKSDLIAGFDLTEEAPEVTDILIDLAQRETMDLSTVLANRLVEELGRVTTLRRNTHRYAGFAVLKAPDVPSVLLEFGYLSNRSEEKKLRSKGHRSKLAEAVVRAVGRYLQWRHTVAAQ